MSDWAQYQVLNKQLRKLEKKQRQQAGSAQNWDAYQFTVSPIAPPSTSIYIRGGRMTWPASWNEGVSYYLADKTLDLANTDASVGPEWPYSCNNANWYVPIYVCISWYFAYSYIEDTGYGEQTYRLFGADYYGWAGGGFVEYETAAEAEAAIDGTNVDFIQDQMTETGLPICRLILRNDGTTGIPNRWMPIDAVNRGRSYLWGQFRNGRLCF